MMIQSFDVPGLDAARTFMRGFDQYNRARGESLFARRSVGDLAGDSVGRTFTAQVLDGEQYGIRLAYQHGLWTSSCTCGAGALCKHAYATMRSLLSHNTRKE